MLCPLFRHLELVPRQAVKFLDCDYIQQENSAGKQRQPSLGP